eukprot:2877178-Pyramimonas_sp.AAC.1
MVVESSPWAMSDMIFSEMPSDMRCISALRSLWELALVCTRECTSVISRSDASRSCTTERQRRQKTTSGDSA